MSNRSELSTKNYKRIFAINALLTVPLLAIFAWPYVVFAKVVAMLPQLYYVGAVVFAVPFTFTILHGHVTLALGSAHRHHYYNWLEDNKLTYGLLFHPMFISTRFRLVLIALSMLIFIVGWLTKA